MGSSEWIKVEAINYLLGTHIYEPYAGYISTVTSPVYKVSLDYGPDETIRLVPPGTTVDVFLSNIYGMPGIGRVFALPKMRKYPHRIMLADEEGLLDNYPAEKSMVTIFKLDAGKKISEIAFWDPRKGEPPLVDEK